MKAGRFFSVHFDMRHNPKIEYLRDMGGGIVALGRWLALMSILYDVGGVFDLTKDAKRRYLCRELELTDDGLTEFLDQCAESELINRELLSIGHVASDGICEQIEFANKKSNAGKKGNAKRWANEPKNND